LAILDFASRSQATFSVKRLLIVLEGNLAVSGPIGITQVGHSVETWLFMPGAVSRTISRLANAKKRTPKKSQEG
jgi:hypothetical protein